MSGGTRFRGNPCVQYDTLWNLTVGSKAFANSTRVRHIATVNAYINSDRFNVEGDAFLSVSPTVAVTALPEHGWDPQCSVSKTMTPANFFTKQKGFLATKTVTNTQILASASIANPKTMPQLVTQSSTLANAVPLPTQAYIGAISMSNAARSVNATSAPKFMGASAFEGCKRLASVQMSSDNAWNQAFSNGCFKGCDALTTMNTVTNPNTNMAGGASTVPPAGTITATLNSKTVTGAGTAFNTTSVIAPGHMIYTAAVPPKYIGTVASVESSISLTLVNPAKAAYTGAWGVNKECMIPAHATRLGQDAFNSCLKIKTVSIETHQQPALAASNSKLSAIGINCWTGCADLTTVYFNVKQKAAISLAGTGSAVVPITTIVQTKSHDGWTSATSQTQLMTLFKAVVSKLATAFTFKYVATVDPDRLDASMAPTKVATINGLAHHDEPLVITNLVIPEFIMHGGVSHEVTSINYIGLDQTETVNGTNLVYGAFSQSNPAFSDGGGLYGNLALAKTIRYVGPFSYTDQQYLSGNLDITCPFLSYIGISAFMNTYKMDYNYKVLTIITANTGIVIHRKAFQYTNFDNIQIN
jgi:hypothetical protein